MEEEENFFSQANRRKFSCCFCFKLRPCNEFFLGGALTLKMVTQICFLLDFFISFSYGLIFVIVHSHVWIYMSFLFSLQTLSTMILLLDTQVFELGKTWVYRTKAYLTVTGLISLVLFYLLQAYLISGKMKGTFFSVHFLIIKSIYDGFQTYFIWSRHLHESG